MGLKEVGKGDFTKYEAGIWVKLKDEKSGQHLELNWYPKGSHFDVPHVAVEGLDHIRFAVDDNIEETYKKLLEKGAEPKPIDHSPTEGWVAHVKDPDGNWIEIFKIPPSQAAK